MNAYSQVGSTLKFQAKPKDFRRFSFTHYRKKKKVRFNITLLICLFISIGWINMLAVSGGNVIIEQPIAFFIMLFLPIAFLSGPTLIIYTQAVQQGGLLETTLTYNQEGFTKVRGSGTSTYYWSQVQEVYDHPNTLTLILFGETVLLIPKRAFTSSSEMEAFKQLIDSGQVRSASA